MAPRRTPLADLVLVAIFAAAVLGAFAPLAAAAGPCERKEVCDLTTFGTLKVGAGVSQDSGAIKHIRDSLDVCLTAASVGAVCTSTIAWTTPFADASYSLFCRGIGAFTGLPIIGAVTARAAASFTVQTIAATASAASFGELDCTAIHDGI